MLNIGNKNFMNLQEAVGWLLENNALPFQSTANYAGNTEIAMSTLINPSPAKVRVGSIIFFADSKVSTVVGVTSNSFIVSDQFNDLVDDVVYVSNVAINASGHLIVTLSNGTDIDAGLIKQVSNFSINASQHLIANYNDGTTTDLGAIFSGNITISGSLSATSITSDSIIENMSGYTAYTYTTTGLTLEILYAGVVKTGNKITFAVAFNAETDDNLVVDNGRIIQFIIPTSIGEKLYPSAVLGGNTLDSKKVNLFSDYATTKDLILYLDKGGGNNSLSFWLAGLQNLTQNITYFGRYEATFLLSNSLI